MGVLFAVLAGLCWGVGEVCARSVLHGGKVGPFMAVAIRSSVALPLIWLAFAAAHRVAPAASGKGLGHLDTREWLLLILGSGVVAGAAAMICFYISLSLGEVSKMKPIAFTVAPAAAVLLGAWFLGESLTARKLVAVGLVITGVLLLATAGPGSARGTETKHPGGTGMRGTVG
ncbi:MAG: EamA family transporter [Phycisphaerales bacterium]|nr:EamA family transporter [Planctomycetota bacterium]MCH8507600.1 EamA family transporter [Phycisphaerales bacterium]